MEPQVGAHISVGGGYDIDPEWLDGHSEVAGTVLKWIPGQNATPACVNRLDEAPTATGDIHGTRTTVTGSYLVLELRYRAQQWESTGTVNVELCESEPEDAAWQNRPSGACVESHATYTVRP